MRLYYPQTIFLLLFTIHPIHTFPPSLTLGFLGPMNLPNSNSQTGGRPALFAFKLAIHDINNRSDILPHTKLNFVNNNTNSDIGTGIIDTFWQCVYGNVVGIVGEYTSVMSQSVQYVSRYYKVPQISYGSTSSEFTKFHSTLYPYFLRTTPNQNLESVLLTHLIASQGWKNVALIYTTDSQTFYSVQVFLASTRKLNITVLVSVSFAAGTIDLTEQMKIIKQSKARIILFIGTIIDQQAVINNSLIEELTGVGYQWIGIHASMYKTLYLNSTGEKIQDYYEWTQGFIGLQNFADVNSDIYKEYAHRWATAPYDPEIPTIDSNSISVIANYAYDACFMFAHALHHMIEVLHLNPMETENRELYLAVLKNVSFLGVSGRINVDENGDRQAPFEIVNFQHGQIVHIGTITADGVVNYFSNVKVLYTGGVEEKPLDLPIRPIVKISFSALIGMIGGSVICTLLCFALIVFTFYFNKHPVVKASSPTFLILMLIGVICLATSIIPRTLENYRQSSTLECISELWFANIGYSLIIGTLLLKTYRLSKIFQMSERIVKYYLTDKYLLFILFGLILLSSAMLTGLCFGDPFYLKLSPLDSMSDYQYCTTKYQLTIYVPLILSTRFALLILTTVCAFKIRKISDLFNETRQLVFSVYNLLFLSVTLPVIDLTMGRGKNSTTIIYVRDLTENDPPPPIIEPIPLRSFAVTFAHPLLQVSRHNEPIQCSYFKPIIRHEIALRTAGSEKQQRQEPFLIQHPQVHHLAANTQLKQPNLNEVWNRLMSPPKEKRIVLLEKNIYPHSPLLVTIHPFDNLEDDFEEEITQYT
ncbi:unnamed protein product [Didymodactylos carnosus]|uniref:G-protein coupled receptors family 3 profile domain-containing protein n=1 Tax=Didymodactylos carnosus TaxID=1234261 RepID=A0A814Y7W8_9BILA|nr:unnamed protein product [Didymodactylos carnosus]CAF1225675.1 unnamed protein product [Didymodactylos carnosus]CAF3721233.1 unnamed protein product [Didymodactylos carnosus]CAF3988595.1 unnamed protein product [Didymodactylos carnosus]